MVVNNRLRHCLDNCSVEVFWCNDITQLASSQEYNRLTRYGVFTPRIQYVFDLYTTFFSTTYYTYTHTYTRSTGGADQDQSRGYQ